MWRQTRRTFRHWSCRTPSPCFPNRCTPLENKPIPILVRLGQGNAAKEMMRGYRAANPDKFCAKVAEMDCLTLARNLVRQGKGRPAVLNMANAFKAGGKVGRGQAAPEEMLCRCTDLMRHLAECKHLYPLKTGTALITHGITVSRDTEEAGYGFLEEPFRITVISCAADLGPCIKEASSRKGTPARADYKDKDAKERMRKNVRVLLEAALLTHCNVTILSALGCGGYGHPPGGCGRNIRARTQSHTGAKCHVRHHRGSQQWKEIQPERERPPLHQAIRRVRGGRGPLEEGRQNDVRWPSSVSQGDREDNMGPARAANVSEETKAWQTRGALTGIDR